MATLVFPQSIVTDAEGRERRCCQSLRVNSLTNVYQALREDEHFIAYVLGEACSVCPLGAGSCTHMKDQFNSTDNSKRRISTLLFWKVRLGVLFPVPDALLKDAWKYLESCDLGIRGNGQCKAKTAQGGHKVCINPFHYAPRTLKHYNEITACLISSLTGMGIWNQDLESIAASIVQQPAKFDAITSYIQNIMGTNRFDVRADSAMSESPAPSVPVFEEIPQAEAPAVNMDEIAQMFADPSYLDCLPDLLQSVSGPLMQIPTEEIQTAFDEAVNSSLGASYLDVEKLLESNVLMEQGGMQVVGGVPLYDCVGQCTDTDAWNPAMVSLPPLLETDFQFSPSTPSSGFPSFPSQGSFSHMPVSPPSEGYPDGFDMGSPAEDGYGEVPDLIDMRHRLNTMTMGGMGGMGGGGEQMFQRAYCRTCGIYFIWQAGAPMFCPHNHNTVTVVSSGADIAYYMPTVYTNTRYEEGDIVGFFDDGEGRSVIKLINGDNHTAAHNAGVISRSAYMAANAPDAVRRAGQSHDLVCMIGYVKVKVRGPVSNGDLLYFDPRQEQPGVGVACGVDDEPPEDALLIGSAIESGLCVGTGSEVVRVKAVVSLISGMFSRDRNKHLAALDRKLRMHIKEEIARLSKALSDKVDANTERVDRLASEVTRTHLRTDEEIRELRAQLDALRSTRSMAGPLACRNAANLPRSRDFKPCTAVDNEVFLILKSLVVNKSLRFATDTAVNAAGGFGHKARFFVVTLPSGGVRLRNLWFGTWLALDDTGRVYITRDEKSPATEFRVASNINGTVALYVPAPETDKEREDREKACAKGEHEVKSEAADTDEAKGGNSGAAGATDRMMPQQRFTSAVTGSGEHRWYLCVAKGGSVFAKRDPDPRDIACMFVSMATKPARHLRAIGSADPKHAAGTAGEACGKGEAGAGSDGPQGNGEEAAVLMRLQRVWAQRQWENVQSQAQDAGHEAHQPHHHQRRHPKHGGHRHHHHRHNQYQQFQQSMPQQEQQVLQPQLGEGSRAFCYNTGLSPRPSVVSGSPVSWEAWTAASEDTAVVSGGSLFRTDVVSCGEELGGTVPKALEYFCIVNNTHVFLYNPSDKWFRCLTATVVPE